MVDLHVDGAQEEIERVTSSGFGRHPYGLWQRWRFARRRQQETQEGQLRWLCKHGSTVARASIVNDVWSRSLHEWIDQAQQNGIVFRRAVSISTALATSLSQRDSACVFVYELAGLRRHVACVDGCVCLSRVIDEDEIPVDALLASIAHVIERWGLSRVSVSLPPESRTWTAEAFSQIRSLCRGKLYVRASVPMADGCERDALLGEMLKPDLLRLFRRELQHRQRASTDLLQAVSAVSHQRSMRRLQVTVALSLLIAVGFAGHAMLEGLEQVQELEQVRARIDELNRQAESLTSEASQHHSAPEAAAQVLESAAHVADSAPLPVPDLLTLLATVLTQHREIALDTLSWTVVSARAGRRESLLIDDGIMQALPVSQRLESLAALGEPERLAPLVEMRGRVVAGGLLKSRQSTAQAFVDALEADAAVDGCELLESPLSAVLAERRATTRQAVDWRLRCLLQAPASIADSEGLG